MLQCSQVMENSAEKVRLAGNQNVMVCERGTMFGYSKLSLVCSYLLKAKNLFSFFVYLDGSKSPNSYFRCFLSKLD